MLVDFKFYFCSLHKIGGSFVLFLFCITIRFHFSELLQLNLVLHELFDMHDSILDYLIISVYPS